MDNISKTVNFDILEKLPDGSYKKKHPETKASQVIAEDGSNLESHLADNTNIKHKAKTIGLENSKFIATNVEEGMYELFTNVSNGKQLVGNAITGVDDSVVIPTEPSFGDLASAVGGISTGRKWASGTTTTKDYQATVSGLPFKPEIIVVFQYDASYLYAAAVYLNEFIPNKSAWISSGEISMRNVNSTKTGEDYVVGGEFRLMIPAFNEQVRWICFE